jgi:hypothetical protein
MILSLHILFVLTFALQPIWIAYIYYPVLGMVLLCLFCVSCRDPGLMERVTDEEAGEGGWFWNEQVGSFRPPGALYCRECGVSLWLTEVNVVYAGTHVFAFSVRFWYKTMITCVLGQERESAEATCWRSKPLWLASISYATLPLSLWQYSFYRACSVSDNSWMKRGNFFIIKSYNAICFIRVRNCSCHRAPQQQNEHF